MSDIEKFRLVNEKGIGKRLIGNKRRSNIIGMGDRNGRNRIMRGRVSKWTERGGAQFCERQRWENAYIFVQECEECKCWEVGKGLRRIA